MTGPLHLRLIRPNRPCDAKRWRWVTTSERAMTQEQRDKSQLSRYWTDVVRVPLPQGDSRSPAEWWAEVELFNGQRVFYRAY